MLETCIVIGSMIGILNSTPDTKLIVYKADCVDSTRFFILDNKPDTIKEVSIIKINSDLTYTIKIAG